MPPSTIDVDLTAKELMHLIDALERGASRHTSMANYNPRAAKPHDDAATYMRMLRDRLIRAGSAFQTKQSA